ncbi:Vesicle-fusing ATPase 2, partial [Fragariocoptes setiger]
MAQLQVASCATNEDGYTNRAFVNPTERLRDHVLVTPPGSRASFLFTLSTQKLVRPGHIAFNSSSRKWASLQTNTVVDVRRADLDVSSKCLSQIQVYVDYLTVKYARDGERETYDTREMSQQFTEQFVNQAFSVGQLLTFVYTIGSKKVFFELKVKSLEALQPGRDIKTINTTAGLCTANTVVAFEKSEDSSYVLNLCGDLAGSKAATQILNPNFDYESLGIGGLSEEFGAVFRRAFASRLFPPNIAKLYHLRYVRGMLLYGPPGTGKTLLARQIGYILNARTPKVVSAPEIMNKFVGESEANVRKLFAEAEEEQKKLGDSSGLHIIIIDELDAICKARSMVAGGANNHTDSVINQLLAKMDGVDSLNNILMIGMTNRRDLIDEALLRPGRFEVQVEIGLPSEEGRREILSIHTKDLKENGKLAPDVDINELAKITKNYSGAELEGLVQAAISIAFNPVVNQSRMNPTPEELSAVTIRMGDFLAAIQRKDIVPSLGASDDIISAKAGAIIEWDTSIHKLMQDCGKVVEYANMVDETAPEGKLVKILLHGSKGSGLTTLAATLAVRGQFPFIRIVTQKDLNGLSELAKVQKLQKIFDDAEKSTVSCILLDSIHLICEYHHIGPRFSNSIFNTFQGICESSPKKGKNLLLIATCSDQNFVSDFDLKTIFRNNFRIPNLTLPEHLGSVIEHLVINDDCPFDEWQRTELFRKLEGLRLQISIKNLLEMLSLLKQSPQDSRLQEFLEELDKSGSITM